MSYVSSTLTSGEEILYEAKISVWSFFGEIIFALFLIFLGMGMLGKEGSTSAGNIVVLVGIFIF